MKVCRKNYGNNFEIVVANNASKDRTLEIAKKLSKKYKEVKYIHLNEKGRGRALRKAWSILDGDILCYMDVDLSTDLKHLKQLTDAIKNGADVAFGTRLVPDSETERCFTRTLYSRTYNLLLKLFFNAKFTDAQCGFKAINSKVAKNIVPYVEGNKWFFDSELLIKAGRNGYKLAEIPVLWVEDLGTTVNIRKIIIEYLTCILKLRYDLWFKKVKTN